MSTPTKTRTRKKKEDAPVVGSAPVQPPAFPPTAIAAPAPRSSQRGVITFDYKMLETLLPLPLGMRIMALVADLHGQRVRLVVASPDLPDVADGARLPEVNIAISDIIDEQFAAIRRTAKVTGTTL